MPPVTKNLLIVNVLVFMATWVFERSGTDLTSLFGLHFFLAIKNAFSVTGIDLFMES